MRAKSIEIKQLAISTSAAYAAVYVAKSILSAISPDINESGVYTKESLGTMGSAFFIAYAVGQMVNGYYGDKIKAKYMVAVGLTGSAVLCFVFTLFANSLFAYVLWAVCGFLCSMLWGPLSKCVAENCEKKPARILMLLLTAASIVGTMFAYIFAAIASKYYGWRMAFYISAVYILITDAVAVIILMALERKNKLRYSIRKKNEPLQEGTQKLTASMLIKAGIIPAVIAIMVNGVVRNSISFWIPTYIQEVFEVTPATASAISILLPIVNLLGAVLSFKMLVAFKDDEHMLSAVLSMIAAVMFLVMFIFKGNGMLELVITVIALMLATASMSGMCNLYFSVYILRFSKTGRISTLSGGFDFAAYLASSAATTIIGRVSSAYGWNFTVGSWIVVMVIGIVVCFYLSKKHKVY